MVLVWWYTRGFKILYVMFEKETHYWHRFFHHRSNRHTIAFATGLRTRAKIYFVLQYYAFHVVEALVSDASNNQGNVLITLFRIVHSLFFVFGMGQSTRSFMRRSHTSQVTYGRC